MFRRIGGRVVPIAVGGALVASAAKTDRVYKVGQSRVAVSQLGKLKLFTATAAGKLKAYAVTTGPRKFTSHMHYIHAFDQGKGFGRDVLKVVNAHERSLGKKFMRGYLATSNTLKFSKDQKSKFVRHMTKLKKFKVVGAAEAEVMAFGAYRQGLHYSSSTRLPNLGAMKSSFNLKSPKLAIAAGLIGYGLLKKSEKRRQ